MNQIKNIFIIPFICLLGLLNGCNADQQTSQDVDNQLFVGTYRVMDQNIPYPFLLEQQEDSIFLVNHKNEVIDKTEADILTFQRGDTLQMKEHSFFVLGGAPKLYFLGLKDSISFPYLHFKTGAYFRMAAETERMDLMRVKKLLSSKTYAAKISVPRNRDLEVIKSLSFSEDSLIKIFSYYYQDSLMYSEQQTEGFQLFERRGKIFLSENGSLEDPKMLNQITGISDDSFNIQFYRNNEKIRETYEFTEEQKTSNIPYYANCLNGDPGHYYYGDDKTYKKGNEFLIQKVAANAPNAEGDGYITVHFNINCDGKVGRLGLEQMDRDYKSTSFNKQLVQHIISEVVNLKDWPEVEPWLFFKDVHAFLMFKIEDGKITDLCP